MPRNRTEHELLIAMNLYCKLPFGQFDPSNKTVQKVAAQMGRTPGALAMKLSNLASLDTYHQDRGVAGLKGASNLDRKVWADFLTDWTGMAEQSETACETLMTGTDVHKPITQQVSSPPTGPSEVERTVKHLPPCSKLTSICANQKLP